MRYRDHELGLSIPLHNFNPSQRIIHAQSLVRRREPQHQINLKIMDEMDRISELPSFIIHHIMSYLSTKEVARCSLLSKSWNDLRTSFPTLDFNQSFFLEELPSDYSENSTQNQFERFSNLLSDFINYVDVSVSRFCELKLLMHTFKLSISLVHGIEVPAYIDKWIEMALEKGVKELEIDVRSNKYTTGYSLPQLIFSAKSVTTLRLHRVNINKKMVQQLISGCPLLEDLRLLYCWGLKRLYVSEAPKLKIIQICTSSGLDVLRKVKIVSPSLESLILDFSHQQSNPCVIDISECSHLRDLEFVGAIFKCDKVFCNILSKLRLLESLSVSRCCFLDQTISIVREHPLKNISLDMCGNLKRLALYIPELVSFSFKNNCIPLTSMHVECPWKVQFIHEADHLHTQWFVDAIKFFNNSAKPNIEELILHVSSRKISFNSNDLKIKLRSHDSHPYEVRNLFLNVKLPSSKNDYTSFMDGLCSLCHPKVLLVETTCESQNKFIKWLYETLTEKDVKCCNSSGHKCWRHYLKEVVKIGSFSTFKGETMNLDDLIAADWDILPPATVQFHLVWH